MGGEMVGQNSIQPMKESVLLLYSFAYLVSKTHTFDLSTMF